MAYKIKLPKKVALPKFLAKSRQYNAVADYLSDEYGFAVNRFDLTKQKGKVYAKNIDWDTSE